MKVDQKFIDSLWFRGGWQLETINNKTYNVINNRNYCRLFWMQFWKDILSEKFRNQNNITQLSDGDLSAKVIIDRDTGNLLSSPAGWSTVYYYGDYNFTEPPLSINANAFLIFILYLIFMFFVTIIIILFSTKNTVTKKTVEFL